MRDEFLSYVLCAVVMTEESQLTFYCPLSMAVFKQVIGTGQLAFGVSFFIASSHQHMARIE